MTGEKLKLILLNTGESMTVISRKLGMSTQALNSLFRAADVRTGTIEKMCAALGLSITDFYGTGDTIMATDNGTAFKGNGNTLSANDTQFLVLLDRSSQQLSVAQTQLTTSQQQINDLIEIIKKK